MNVAVELVTDQVGDAGRAALDDNRVIVGRHDGLGQSAVVERRRVGEWVVGDLDPGIIVQVDRVSASSPCPPCLATKTVGQRDRVRVHRLGELDGDGPREDRCAGDLGAVVSLSVKVIGLEGTSGFPSSDDDRSWHSCTTKV